VNEQQEPTEEELRAALEEQLKRISVEDVILQTVVTLVNLSGRRLTGEEKDLAQARLGIEAVRALLPLCAEEQAKPVREALSQLQMAFAREAREAGAAAPAGPSPQGPSGQEDAPRSEPGEGPSEAERAKARAKIWTPPGT
jgi:hypothetical protein